MCVCPWLLVINKFFSQWFSTNWFALQSVSCLWPSIIYVGRCSAFRVSCARESWETLMYCVREWQTALWITHRIGKSWRFVECDCVDYCRVWCDTVLSGRLILKWWRNPSIVWIDWCILWRRSSNFPEMFVFVFKLQTSERGSPSILSSRHIFPVHQSTSQLPGLLKERGHLEDLGLEDRIILKRIFKK